MYLIISTRPDIAYAVNQVSKEMQSPTTLDWKKIKSTICNSFTNEYRLDF